MTRMSSQAEARRAEMENVLANIARARVLLTSQVTLRVRQASSRDNADLLTPALEQLAEVERALVNAQAALGSCWRQQERHGWPGCPVGAGKKKQ